MQSCGHGGAAVNQLISLTGAHYFTNDGMLAFHRAAIGG